MKKIYEDLKTLKQTYNISYVMSILSNRGFHALLFYRISNFLYKCKVPILPLIFTRIIQIIYSIDIDYRAKIEGGVIIIHGVGTVIGSGATIKSGTIIYHQVTIGIKGNKMSDGFATIEENCILGAGAKILGKLTIGMNSIIGANVVVIKDIPQRSIVTTSAKIVIRQQ
jgi:serine O-acetyltransferase